MTAQRELCVSPEHQNQGHATLFCQMLGALGEDCVRAVLVRADVREAEQRVILAARASQAAENFIRSKSRRPGVHGEVAIEPHAYFAIRDTLQELDALRAVQP